MKDILQNIINQGNRTFYEPDVLNKVANIIALELKKYCDIIDYQEFDVDGKTFYNVIGIIIGEVDERIIVSSHYDVVTGTDGADDNGSAIVGIIETAKLIKEQGKPYNTIELVSYCLEEPPNFGTENMGSYHHAQKLFDEKIKVKAMLNYEMIGFYTDVQPQLPFIDLPSKGNFIAFAGRQNETELLKDIESKITQNKNTPVIFVDNHEVESLISLSDNINFWKFGFKAIMITDTAFVRNKNYHTSFDLIDTINIDKIKDVCYYVTEYIKG